MGNYCKTILKRYKPKVVPLSGNAHLAWPEKSCWSGTFKSEVYAGSYGSKLFILENGSTAGDAERSLNEYLVIRCKEVQWKTSVKL